LKRARNSDTELLQERNERWGDGNVHYCTYFISDGSCVWSDFAGDIEVGTDLNVPGVERSNVVGMLLDLDEGTLAVYVNGRRQGVIKDGLTGDYCWGTETNWTWNGTPSVEIERGQIPV